jgi:N-methylhydantoinase A
VYTRERLPAGTEFNGPLIVEQMDATTVVPPKAKFMIDASGVIVLELEPMVGPVEAAWTSA